MRPRLLLVLIAALAAAGLLVWSLQDRTPAVPQADLESDEASPGTVDEADLMASRGGDVAARPGEGPDGGANGAAGRRPAVAPLTGRVLDETGRPIAGADVALFEIDPEGLRGAPYPDRATGVTARSDRDGAFALEAPVDRWLRVRASAPGRATVARRVASAGAHVEIVLPVAGALLLTVVDHVGAPQHGVDLRVVAGETVVEAASGTRGVALLDDLPPGTVRVRARWPSSGAHTVAGPFTVRSGSRTEALVLLPRGTDVEGVVLDDETGKPVAGAQVHVSHPGHALAAAPTDAAGRFGPIAGGSLGERVFLAVRAEGYAPLLEPVVLRLPGQQEVVLRLGRGTPWTGVVQHADGRPAAGATVGYTADGIAGRPPAETTADERGRFELPPPPKPAPGRRIVLVARTATALGALALRPDTPRPASILITVAEGSTVQGRVESAAGAPIAGATVRLSPAWDRVQRGATVDAAAARLLAANEEGFVGLAGATGPDGRWTVRAVAAGPYRVVFEHEGARHPRADDLDVRGPVVDAGTERLGAGLTLEGTVRDERGAPLSGADVRIAQEGVVGRSRRTSTRGDGAFTVHGLAAGRYRVTATHGGRDPLVGFVDLVEGEDALIAMDFDAAAALEAVVRRGETPYTGVLTVALRGTSGSRRAQRTVRVQGGVLRLADLPTGTYTLEARAAERTAQLALVREVALRGGQTTELRIDLAARASLHGVVRTPGGRAVASARVALEERGSSGLRRFLATTDARGVYHFEELQPGGYALSASGSGGGPVVVEIDLEAGSELERDVALAPAGTLEVHVVDDRGRAGAGVLVAWRNDAGTSRSLTPARTDAGGRLTLRDVPAGEDLTVRARAPDGRAVTQRTRAAADATTKLVLRLPKAP